MNTRLGVVLISFFAMLAIGSVRAAEDPPASAKFDSTALAAYLEVSRQTLADMDEALDEAAADPGEDAAELVTGRWTQVCGIVKSALSDLAKTAKKGSSSATTYLEMESDSWGWACGSGQKLAEDIAFLHYLTALFAREAKIYAAAEKQIAAFLKKIKDPYSDYLILKQYSSVSVDRDEASDVLEGLKDVKISVLAMCKLGERRKDSTKTLWTKYLAEFPSSINVGMTAPSIDPDSIPGVVDEKINKAMAEWDKLLITVFDSDTKVRGEKLKPLVEKFYKQSFFNPYPFDKLEVRFESCETNYRAMVSEVKRWAN